MRTLSSDNSVFCDVHRILRVSAYDRVASFLAAAIALATFVVALMFFAWLTGSWQFETSFVVSAGESAFGTTLDSLADKELAPPDAAELAVLTDADDKQVFESAIQAATLASAVGPVSFGGDAPGESTSGPRSLGPGPQAAADVIPRWEIPRWERWEIHYESNNIDEYARQLDYFQIELGAAGGGLPQADYASQFSTSPRTRSGAAAEEKRLYMTWTSGTMKAFDRRLLADAGVATAGRVVLQFYPPATEDRIAEAELEYARRQGIDPRTIQKTIMAVEKTTEDNYQYRVVDQRFRAPSASIDSNRRPRP